MIKTTSNLRLEVSNSICFEENKEGRKRTPDEIALIVSGYSSNLDTEIEEVVTISKEEAQKLIEVLFDLI